MLLLTQSVKIERTFWYYIVENSKKRKITTFQKLTVPSVDTNIREKGQKVFFYSHKREVDSSDCRSSVHLIQLRLYIVKVFLKKSGLVNRGVICHLIILVGISVIIMWYIDCETNWKGEVDQQRQKQLMDKMNHFFKTRMTFDEQLKNLWKADKNTVFIKIIKKKLSFNH